MKFRDFIKQLDALLAVRYGRQPFAATGAVDTLSVRALVNAGVHRDDIRECWEAGCTPAQAAALLVGDHSNPALDNTWTDENDNIRFWRE